jgi:hypothetical protein
MQRLTISPYSYTRCVWDSCGVCLLCFDMFMIPLLVFETDMLSLINPDEYPYDGKPGIDIMTYVTSTFWTVDIIVSMLTGYENDGHIELAMSKIVRYHMRTLAFDVFLVIFDWFFIFISDTGAADIGRLGKIRRLFRLSVLRLTRIVNKLPTTVRHSLDQISSEKTRACVDITIAISVILTSCHYISCGWYICGMIGFAMRGPNWLDANDLVHDQSGIYIYMTSLHWCLTQFTPAGMEVRPYNLVERVYSIVLLLVALVSFTTFLGSISQSMGRLRQSYTDRTEQQNTLRRYFEQNHVSNELVKKIQFF